MLNWKYFVIGVLRAAGPDYFKSKNRTTMTVYEHKTFAASNKSSTMKNKTFDPRLRESAGNFQKSPFKIFFSFSGKKRRKSLTIKDVFYESVNFRWDEFDNELY